jgi:hypothetical protein
MAGGNAKGRKRRRKVKPDNPAQSKCFIEAAKALGTDESGEAFGKVLGEMLKPRPKPKDGSS